MGTPVNCAGTKKKCLKREKGLEVVKSTYHLGFETRVGVHFQVRAKEGPLWPGFSSMCYR